MSETNVEALSREIGQLEAELDATRTRLAKLRRERADAAAQETKLQDLLGEGADGERLPLAPLLLTVFGTTVAMGNVVAVYIMGIMVVGRGRPDSDTPGAILAWFLCSLVALVCLRYGRRPGAGGSARGLLRPIGGAMAWITTIAGFLLATLGYAGLLGSSSYGY